MKQLTREQEKLINTPIEDDNGLRIVYCLGCLNPAFKSEAIKYTKETTLPYKKFRHLDDTPYKEDDFFECESCKGKLGGHISLWKNSLVFSYNKMAVENDI